MSKKNKKMKNQKVESEGNKVTKASLIVVAVLLFIGLGFVVSSGPKNSNPSSTAENVEVRDGVQYVTIKAKGGYTPRISNAKAGIPTKLLVDTNGTYDCSASLVINSLNYRKILPQNGETEIDLGIPVAGIPLQGLCGMGMYNFEINFS